MMTTGHQRPALANDRCAVSSRSWRPVCRLRRRRPEHVPVISHIMCACVCKAFGQVKSLSAAAFAFLPGEFRSFSSQRAKNVDSALARLLL